MLKRTKALIVAGVAALAVAAAGVSWAYFSESATASAAGGNGADMQPVGIVGSPSYVFDVPQGLYPGHSASVKIKVHNGNDVAVTITTVAPLAVGSKTVTGGTTPDDATTRQYCTDQLTLAAAPAVSSTSGSLAVAAGDDLEITLNNAVTLAAAADNRCQGMIFTTAWKVDSASS